MKRSMLNPTVHHIVTTATPGIAQVGSAKYASLGSENVIDDAEIRVKKPESGGRDHANR